MGDNIYLDIKIFILSIQELKRKKYGEILMEKNQHITTLKNVVITHKKDNIKDIYNVNYSDPDQKFKIRFLKKSNKSKKSKDKEKDKKDDKIIKYLDFSIPIMENYLSLEKLYKLYTNFLEIKIPSGIEIELYFYHGNPYKINYKEITTLEILNINNCYILNMGFIIH